MGFWNDGVGSSRFRCIQQTAHRFRVAFLEYANTGSHFGLLLLVHWLLFRFNLFPIRVLPTLQRTAAATTTVLGGVRAVRQR